MCSVQVYGNCWERVSLIHFQKFWSLLNKIFSSCEPCLHPILNCRGVRGSQIPLFVSRTQRSRSVLLLRNLLSQFITKFQTFCSKNLLKIVKKNIFFLNGIFKMLWARLRVTSSPFNIHLEFLYAILVPCKLFNLAWV